MPRPGFFRGDFARRASVEKRTRIFFDGGARPNPGRIDVAAVLRGVAHVRHDLGHGTNNDAEWLALIHAVEVALSLALNDVEFVGDSLLVVNQASGAWKCRGPELQAHLRTYQELVAGIPRARVRHVRRSKNLAGIVLARTHPR